MTFRKQELETFREQMEALKKETSSRLIIICGAGVTRASVAEEYEEKFSWSGLIKQGLLEVQKNIPLPTEIAEFITSEKKYRTEQLLDFASFIQNNLEKNQYANWLRNNVGYAVRWDDKNSNKQVLLKALVESAEIEEVSLATTNYDYLLSRAQGWTTFLTESTLKPINWLETSVLSSWSRGAPECRQKVLHLHGDASDADSVIFSKEDYERLNTNNWTDKIRSVLTLNHVVLFVGCGGTLEDPAFEKILDLYEENIGANRFNQRWFKLASRSEDVPLGVNKLTYGDEHHHLPIFAKEKLLPLLKQVFLNEVIVEQTSITKEDFGSGDKEDSDLLNKALKKIFDTFQDQDKQKLLSHLILNSQNNNQRFQDWLNLHPIKKISEISYAWTKLKNEDKNLWDQVKIFLMLSIIQAFVKCYNDQNLGLIDDYVKDFENCILPIMVVINIRYGVGCNLDLVDGKWRAINLIKKSAIQPAEAYKDESKSSLMLAVSPLMLNLEKQHYVNEQIISDFETYEANGMAKLAILIDDNSKLTDFQNKHLADWGAALIEPDHELAQELQDIFQYMSERLSQLSTVTKQPDQELPVTNLERLLVELKEKSLLNLNDKQYEELVKNLNENPDINQNEEVKKSANKIWKAIENLKTSSETVIATAAATPIVAEFLKHLISLFTK